MCENMNYYKNLSKLSSWSLYGIADDERGEGVVLRLIFFCKKVLHRERIRAHAYVILYSVKPVGRHSYPRS